MLADLPTFLGLGGWGGIFGLVFVRWLRVWLVCVWVFILLLVMVVC